MVWDPVWDQVFRGREWGKYPGEELIRFVARNFYSASDRKNVKLLEVGSGTGANLWYMAREGFSVYGIDGSTEAIRRASERLNRECPDWSGEIVQGEISRLPFPDDTFDAVIDNEAVCCNSFDSAQSIYKEMLRVAKRGGKLYSRTFAEGCWGDGTGEPVGYRSWIVGEGPLLGQGYVRFTAEEDIPLLIQDFQLTEKKMITWSSPNGQCQVKEWVIHGVKP